MIRLSFLKSVRMTTAIAALVVSAIIGSIAIVSGAIYFNLHAEAMHAGKEQQSTNLATAATILERRLSGSVLRWAEDSTMGAFQSWAIPPFYDTEIVDSITRVTKQDATIYGWDAAAQKLVGLTTSLMDSDGARATGLTIDSSSSAYAPVMAKEQFLGHVHVNGVDYLAAIHPIEKMSGEVMGAIFVGTPMASVEASANSVLAIILMVGGAVTLALGSIGFVLSRLITRPIPRLAGAMGAIAEGDLQASVPYLDLRNEVGGMARAVEVFRQNGLRISQMTEAEADRIILDQQNRQKMMAELQSAFGDVVDAAVAGDFSRQVTVRFPDPELSNIADGLNRLMSTFDRGATEVGQVLRAMANTDLTKRMVGQYEGAFGLIKGDVNAVAEKLTGVVGQLRTTSGSLRSATSEMLVGSSDLSERTTKQAGTIEETSATMEQLANTVVQNAQLAEDARANAIAVASTAEEGGEVMNTATGAMERITQSSGQISGIIGMIDDIAFQTNLLALNASVEAARAGDAGKGFAVVAVEVRRLAQSAAQASAEVKELIEQSTGEITNGSRLVLQAAEKLSTILVAIRRNSDLLTTIATQSREQALALEHINDAVRTMDEMTQHNAALVEQTNAAIAQAEAQATELDGIVDVFRIDPQAVDEASERPSGTPLRLVVQRSSRAGSALAEKRDET